MIATGSRESVIQNLEDAGCESEMIQDFMGWFDKGQQAKQLELLEHQREYLLGRVHMDERRKVKMSKKILVISTSLRKESNSDMLAEAFMNGAREAGHEVETAGEIVEKMLHVDVLVFATPIYYYEMSG